MMFSRVFNILFMTVLLLMIPGGIVNGGDYLSGGEVGLIGAGSVGSIFLGSAINSVDSIPRPLIGGPLPLERSFQKWLGGSYRADKTNIFDGSVGSAITPVACGILLFSADLAYPQGDKSKTVLQDQFLYISGLAATKGVTSIFKGLFNRERPASAMYPEEATRRKHIDNRYDRQSFFSGHTSSAFFAASFLNMRVRSIMRERLTPGEYKDYRWLSPVVLYGWAGIVGWSRIHAYKHFLSDVIIGAAAGYVMSELFLSFGKNTYGGEPGMISRPIARITIRF